MNNVKELRNLFSQLNNMFGYIKKIEYERDIDLEILQSLVLDMMNTISKEIDYREENYL